MKHAQKKLNLGIVIRITTGGASVLGKDNNRGVSILKKIFKYLKRRRL